jgi:hypothetical protein
LRMDCVASARASIGHLVTSALRAMLLGINATTVGDEGALALDVDSLAAPLGPLDASKRKAASAGGACVSRLGSIDLSWHKPAKR